MADTGQNSSADRQAVISITSDGTLITKAFADALSSAMRIEFPASLDEEGRFDFLSTSALNQIVTQLPSNSEFQRSLGSLISQTQFTASLVPSITASEEFTSALDVSVSEAFANDSNLTTAFNFVVNPTNLPRLGTFLSGETNFVTSISTAVIGTSEYQNDVEARISAAVERRSLVFTETLTLDSQRQVTVTFPLNRFPTGVEGDYVIAVNFRGTGDTSIYQEVSRTASNIVYQFGGTAAAGETVDVNYTILN